MTITTQKLRDLLIAWLNTPLTEAEERGAIASRVPPRIDAGSETAMIVENLVALDGEIAALAARRAALITRCRMLIEDHVGSRRRPSSRPTPDTIRSPVAA